MITGSVFAAHLAIDAGIDQALGQVRAEQQVIEPQSGIT